MLGASASLLNIPVVILDVGDQAPAKQILAQHDHIDGAFSDPVKIRELATKVDVLTVEIEHVNVDVLEEVGTGTAREARRGRTAWPGSPVTGPRRLKTLEKPSRNSDRWQSFLFAGLWAILRCK